MSEQAVQQQTAADALAQRVETRRGTGSPWAEALRELGAVDRAVYQAVARTPTPALDRPFRRLTDAATYSRLWFGIAAVIALTGGEAGTQGNPPAARGRAEGEVPQALASLPPLSTRIRRAAPS
jgi:hypothetical protein